jgi:hypothetical protein
MNTYRLRIELPLQPAVSADVAGAIVDLGGCVVGVDLREVDGTAAIDEIVVELPDRLDGSSVRAALEEDTDAALLSSRRCTRDEPITQAIRWARQPEPHHHEDATDLSHRLTAACPLSNVWVGPTVDAGTLPAVQMTLERGAPVVHHATNLPESLSGSRHAPRWLLAVPDRYPDPDNVALLARPLSLRFTPAEVARIELLMAS